MRLIATDLSSRIQDKIDAGMMFDAFIPCHRCHKLHVIREMITIYDQSDEAKIEYYSGLPWPQNPDPGSEDYQKHIKKAELKVEISIEHVCPSCVKEGEIDGA